MSSPAAAPPKFTVIRTDEVIEGLKNEIALIKVILKSNGEQVASLQRQMQFIHEFIEVDTVKKKRAREPVDEPVVVDNKKAKIAEDASIPTTTVVLENDEDEEEYEEDDEEEDEDDDSDVDEE